MQEQQEEEAEDNPPPAMHGAVGGTPEPGDSEGGESDDERRGRWDKRPHKRNKKRTEKEKTDEEKYGEATEDKIRFSRALGKAIGETTKRSSLTPIRIRTCQTPGYPGLANHLQGSFRSQPIPVAGRGGPYQIRLVETKRITSSILHYNLQEPNDR